MRPRDQRRAVHRRVETVARFDGRRVHRFQVVRERREDGPGADDEEWIVVGFDEGGDEVRLADRDFEWTRTAPRSAFASGRFEPLTAGDVPVWGY